MVPGTNKVDPANHNQLGADTDVLSQLRSGAVEFFTPPSSKSEMPSTPNINRLAVEHAARYAGFPIPASWLTSQRGLFAL